MGKVTKFRKKEPVRNERTVKISVARCLTPEFSQAIKRLVATPLKPVAAMKMKRASLAIYKEMQKYVKGRTEIFEKYCDRDEKGEIVYEDEKQSAYKVGKKNEQVCLEELNKLTEVEFEIPTIGVSAFYGDSLTPEFLGLLDGIVEEDAGV